MTPEEYSIQLRKEEFQQRPGSKTDVLCRCGKSKMFQSLMGSVYTAIKTVLFCRTCCSECTIFRDPNAKPKWNPTNPLT